MLKLTQYHKKELLRQIQNSTLQLKILYTKFLNEPEAKHSHFISAYNSNEKQIEYLDKYFRERGDNI